MGFYFFCVKKRRVSFQSSHNFFMMQMGMKWSWNQKRKPFQIVLEGCFSREFESLVLQRDHRDRVFWGCLRIPKDCSLLRDFGYEWWFFDWIEGKGYGIRQDFIPLDKTLKTLLVTSIFKKEFHPMYSILLSWHNAIRVVQNCSRALVCNHFVSPFSRRNSLVLLRSIAPSVLGSRRSTPSLVRRFTENSSELDGALLGSMHPVIRNTIKIE